MSLFQYVFVVFLSLFQCIIRYFLSLFQHLTLQSVRKKMIYARVLCKKFVLNQKYIVSNVLKSNINKIADTSVHYKLCHCVAIH